MVPFCPFLKCLRELKWILGKALQDSANLVLEDDILIKVTKIVTAKTTSQWTTSECHTQCKILSLSVSYEPMRYTLALFSKKRSWLLWMVVTGSLWLRLPWIIVTSWLSKGFWTNLSNYTHFIKHWPISNQMTFYGKFLEHSYWLLAFMVCCFKDLYLKLFWGHDVMGNNSI